MSIKNKINQIKRNVLATLTKNIGNQSNFTEGDLDPMEIKKVLIVRTNHRLGNLLLITPLVQEVIKTFPNAKIDLIVQGGVAPIIFKNYTEVDRIISLPKKAFKFPLKYIRGVYRIKRRRYDMSINAVRGSSSGRLFTQMSTSKFKVFGDENEELEKEYSDYRHISKLMVYSLRNYLRSQGVAPLLREVSSINIKLTDKELNIGKNLLKEITKNDKNTIALFTFATGNKCYPSSWWLPFYNKLKTTFPQYNIVEVLPVENVSQIDFKAPSYYSKDVREIAAFIANTEVWVGGDSGIMHLASASQTPVVGLFSSKTEYKYEPFGNGSIAVNTNEHTTDEIIQKIKSILD